MTREAISREKMKLKLNIFALAIWLLTQFETGITQVDLISNKSPYFNVKYIRKLRQDVTACTISELVIPQDFFLDEEDQGVQNMNLTLLKNVSPDVELPKTFWIGFDESRRRIVAVPDDNAFKFLDTNRTYQVYLCVTDSGGKRASALIKYYVNGRQPPGFYNITFGFDVSFLNVVPNSIQVDYLVKKISSLIPGNPAFYVRSYSTKSQSNNTTINHLVLSPCHSAETVCNVTTIQTLRQVLFVTGSMNMSSVFNAPLNANFKVTKIWESHSKACSVPTPTIYLTKAIPKLYVGYCKPLIYQIPEDTFSDSIDGSTRNLALSVKNQDGSTLKNNSLVFFDKETQTLYAIQRDEHDNLKFSMENKFVLSAVNTRGQSIKTLITLIVNSTRPLAPFFIRFGVFWKYVPPFSMTKMLTKMAEKLLLYFKGLYFYRSVQQVSWPDYFLLAVAKCDQNTTDCNADASRNLTMSNKGINQQLLNVMLPDFVIMTSDIYHTERCKIKNFKPRCRKPLAPIHVNPCSSFSKQLTLLDFSDTEDGTNLTYTISKINGKQYTSNDHNWITVDSKSRLIYGLIVQRHVSYHRDVAYNITILATDSGELSVASYFMLYLRELPPTFYTVNMSISLMSVRPPTETSTLSELFGVQNILNVRYFGLNITHLLSYTKISTTERQLTWSVCTINQCNSTAALEVRKMLFNASNKIQQRLLENFTPNFSLNTLTMETDSICSGPMNPPITHRDSWTINGSFCGGFKVQIPEDLFHDSEDGGTRNLSLRLLDQQGQTLKRSSWITFNFTSQEVIGFPTRSQVLPYADSGAFFTIQAKDKTGLTSTMTLKISFSFPSQEPQYIYSFRYIPTDLSESMLSSTFVFASKLASFLGDEDMTNIGLVISGKQNGASYQIAYSNCSVNYHPCDIQSLTKIKSKLFVNNELHPELDARLETRFMVYQAFTRATGICLNETITTTKNSVIVFVESCGFKSVLIQDSWFGQVSRSGSFPLHYQLISAQGHLVNADSWMNVHPLRKVVLISMLSTQVTSKQESFKFTLVAKDTAGNTGSIPLVIRKRSHLPSLPVFNVTLTLRFSKPINKSFAWQQVTLIQKLASLLQLPIAQIQLLTFAKIPSIEGYIKAAWSICGLNRCSRRIAMNIDYIYDLFYDNARQITRQVQEHFHPEAEIESVYIRSLCNISGKTPLVFIPIQPLYISSCTFFRFKLPENTFYDEIRGDALELDLQLLLNDGSSVDSSGWLQFNSASSTLFGYALASEIKIQTMHTFRISASNRAGISTYSEFFVTLHNESMNITNCPVSIQVRKKTPTFKTADVTILYSLVNMISSYYGDTDTRIKLLTFRKTGLVTYSLVYSNCSFTSNSRYGDQGIVAPSEQALLPQTFSKILTTTNRINQRFKSFMSPSFEILFASTSFGCLQSNISNVTSTEIHNIAYSCQVYRDVISSSLFTNVIGTNVQLTMQYFNRMQIQNNEWLYLDSKTNTVYGHVTRDVKVNSPSDGYKYILKATNLKNKSVNIIYKVEVPEPLPFYSVNFTIGFRYRSSLFNSKTRVLVDIVEIIAKYLDPSIKMPRTNLYIQQFWDESRLTFSYCPLRCEVKKILAKFQYAVFYSQPNQDFISALQPTYDLYYVYMEGHACQDKVNITTIVTTPSTWTINTCGLKFYQLPSDLFTDKENRQTRDYKLELVIGNSILANSSTWISLDYATQRITAVPVGSRLSTNIQYKIVAKHPVTNVIASTDFFIRVQDVNNLSLAILKVCSIKATFWTQYDYSYSDVFVLKRLVNKLADYYTSSPDHVHIYNYSRHQWNHEISITWTNCSWIRFASVIQESEGYQREVRIFLSKIFTDLQSNLNEQWKKYLTPEFKIISVDELNHCAVPQSKLKARRSHIDLSAGCGEFRYKLPNDIFYHDNGNDDNIRLEMYLRNGMPLPKDTWVYLNTTSQTLHGLPGVTNNNSITDRIYQYIIKAVDSRGNSKAINLSIHITHNYTEAGYSLLVQGQYFQSYKYDIQKILYITRKLSTSRFSSDTSNKLYLVNKPTFNPLVFQVANCSVCDITGNLILQSYVVNLEEIKALVRPEVRLYNMNIREHFSVDMQQLCGNDTEAHGISSGSLEATFCSRWEYEMASILQSPISNFSTVYVRAGDKQSLPQNSWFWFNQSDNKLYGFPSREDYKAQFSLGTRFTYYVLSTRTMRSLGMTGFRYAVIKDNVRIQGPEIRITLTVKSQKAKINAYFMQYVYQRLSTYINRTDLQRTKFQHYSSPFSRFAIYFKICGLSEFCVNTEMKEIHEKIWNERKFKGEFLNLFLPELELNHFEIVCNDSRPEIDRSHFQIFVQTCLHQQHIIPFNLTRNKWGQHYNVRLHHVELSTINTTDWIKVNKTESKIYTFLDSNYNRSLFKFQLISSRDGIPVINTTLIAYILEANVSSCENGTVIIIDVPPSQAKLAWWIWIIVLAVLFVVFLLWLCWVCLPFCCPEFCFNFTSRCPCCSGCCKACCIACYAPGGRCSSVKRRTGSKDVSFQEEDAIAVIKGNTECQAEKEIPQLQQHDSKFDDHEIMIQNGNIEKEQHEVWKYLKDEDQLFTNEYMQHEDSPDNNTIYNNSKPKSRQIETDYADGNLTSQNTSEKITFSDSDEPDHKRFQIQDEGLSSPLKRQSIAKTYRERDEESESSTKEDIYQELRRGEHTVSIPQLPRPQRKPWNFDSHESIQLYTENEMSSRQTFSRLPIPVGSPLLLAGRSGMFDSKEAQDSTENSQQFSRKGGLRHDHEREGPRLLPQISEMSTPTRIAGEKHQIFAHSSTSDDDQQVIRSKRPRRNKLPTQQGHPRSFKHSKARKHDKFSPAQLVRDRGYYTDDETISWTDDFEDDTLSPRNQGANRERSFTNLPLPQIPGQDEYNSKKRNADDANGVLNLPKGKQQKFQNLPRPPVTRDQITDQKMMANSEAHFENGRPKYHLPKLPRKRRDQLKSRGLPKVPLSRNELPYDSDSVQSYDARENDIKYRHGIARSIENLHLQRIGKSKLNRDLPIRLSVKDQEQRQSRRGRDKFEEERNTNDGRKEARFKSKTRHDKARERKRGKPERHYKDRFEKSGRRSLQKTRDALSSNWQLPIPLEHRTSPIQLGQLQRKGDISGTPRGDNTPRRKYRGSRVQAKSRRNKRKGENPMHQNIGYLSDQSDVSRIKHDALFALPIPKEFMQIQGRERGRIAKPGNKTDNEFFDLATEYRREVGRPEKTLRFINDAYESDSRV